MGFRFLISSAHSPLVLALVALVALQLFRADHQWYVAYVVADSTLVLALAAAASRRISDRRVAWMLLFSLLPIGVQCVARQFAIGDPNEIIALLCIQNAALVTALSPVVLHRRMSCLLSSFLVLFVVFATVDPAVYFAAGVFGFLGIWTLMGNYWDRLSVRLATHSRRQVPLRGSLMLVSLLGLLLVLSLGLFWGRHAQAPVLAGFMPTSGGDRWGDAYSRSGVGEGDQLISATDHASTVGPVESDLFLASEQPSLYDAFNDTYGEPVRRTPRERAIALDAKLGRESEQKIAESQQAGRDFRDGAAAGESAAILGTRRPVGGLAVGARRRPVAPATGDLQSVRRHGLVPCRDEYQAAPHLLDSGGGSSVDAGGSIRSPEHLSAANARMS